MKRLIAASALAALLASSAALAQTSNSPSARPVFTPEGVVHVPAFDLPPSGYLSPEALEKQRSRARSPGFNPAAPASIEQQRAGVEAAMAPQVAASQARYAVTITPQVIAGVPTQVVMPTAGEANRRRVLINLHGGGFQMCAQACAMLESVPMAGIGRYKVITVNYRQGPENQYPAASQDVAAVYRDLLRTYRPENIGIYGCSAGGALTAQVAAWLQHENLPNPGAIGIFGAGGVRFSSGDSAYVTAYTDGSFPAPSAGGSGLGTGYFAGADMNDPMISPAAHREIAARFPPTLIITGTRATDMSPAVYTHSQLLNAGVDSQLIVGEGMGHCYIYDVGLPESRDAWNYAVRFFDTHLGHRPSRH